MKLDMDGIVDKVVDKSNFIRIILFIEDTELCIFIQ